MREDEAKPCAICGAAPGWDDYSPVYKGSLGMRVESCDEDTHAQRISRMAVFYCPACEAKVREFVVHAHEHLPTLVAAVSDLVRAEKMAKQETKGSEPVHCACCRKRLDGPPVLHAKYFLYGEPLYYCDKCAKKLAEEGSININTEGAGE